MAYYVVDSSCVVPMSQIPLRQFGAYTIRPKIKKVLAKYFKAPDELRVRQKYSGSVPDWNTLVTEKNIPELVSSCEIDHSVKPSLSFTGGRLEAEKLLAFFLEKNLRRYAEGRNEPAEHATSHLSPYLHFGQISSLEIAHAVRDYADKHQLIADEYMEELIVRRELSFNYARSVAEPGRLENLPDWCRRTMKKHASDKRDRVYSAQQLIDGETYDELWNATQKEMLMRGKFMVTTACTGARKFSSGLPGISKRPIS